MALRLAVMISPPVGVLFNGEELATRSQPNVKCGVWQEVENILTPVDLWHTSRQWPVAESTVRNGSKLRKVPSIVQVMPLRLCLCEAVRKKVCGVELAQPPLH